jgi:transcriptional regulator with XRE-family HTH domain
MKKIIDIYNHSELSISKFAKILNKDRRTISSWIYQEVSVEPKKDVLDKISIFFRYPNEIWDENCQGEQFLTLINTIPTKDVRIIDESHANRLRYILNKEDEQRLVLHPKFPGAVYRDAIAPKLYAMQEDKEVSKLKELRIKKML